MAANVDVGVIQGGINLINTTATQIIVCSSEPTTFAQATATYLLGYKSWAAGGAFVTSSVNGAALRVGSTNITDGTITTSGTASWWAVVNSTVLMAHGSLSAAQSVTVTNQFTLGTFYIQIPWQ